MSILDLLFPKFCLGCLCEGTYLCQSCQEKIVTIKYQTCPVCPVITNRGAWCSGHRHMRPNTPEVFLSTSGVNQKKPEQALSGIMAYGYYHDPILREAIHLLKYRRIDEIAQLLAQLALPHFKPLLPHSKVVLVPVPLHPWRKRYRDFNQAELVAKQLAYLWQLPYQLHSLIRTKHSQPQADLPHQQRLINVKNSFAWLGEPNAIKGKTVWLVDDVATTGATLEACARVIKAAGAKSVWGLVLAKG